MIRLLIIIFWAALFLPLQKNISAQKTCKITAPNNLSDIFKDLNNQECNQLEILLDKNQTFSFSKDEKYTNDIELVFKINPTENCSLVIKNITFENYRSITIRIEKPALISLENCKFINLNSLTFEFNNFKNIYVSGSTKINIRDCYFEDTDLINNSNFISSMILFRRNRDSEEFSILKDVEIDNCTFIMKDGNPSFIKYGYYPTRNFIFFERRDENVCYQNITISNSKFEADSKYFRNFGVIFTNIKGNSNFRNKPLSHYLYNNYNINISGNVLKTNSDDPGHGIFIQGPFKDIKIVNNKIVNFGASIRGQTLSSDGALHIYGARFGGNKYSNNCETVLIKDNYISSRSHGIVLSGVKDGNIRSNEVIMIPESNFYADSTRIKRLDRIGILNTTGDVTDSSSQSENIEIEANNIYCNGINASVGIAIHPTKNVIIRENLINKPNNYGILYYSNKNYVNQFLNNFIVENNVIDYSGQNYNSLNSYFYKFTNKEYAGINFTRITDSKYIGEYVIIQNNKIISKENQIKTVILNLGQDETNNIYIESNNVLLKSGE